MYLFATALRKLPGGEGGLVVVGMPLSNIISQQLQNSYCPILTLSMSAEMSGTSCQATGAASLSNPSSGQKISMADAVSGRFFLLFTHPEAIETAEGQVLMRELSRRGLIRGVVADEVHQGLAGHWESFRPGMLRSGMSPFCPKVSFYPLILAFIGRCSQFGLMLSLGHLLLLLLPH